MDPYYTDPHHLSNCARNSQPIGQLPAPLPVSNLNADIYIDVPLPLGCWHSALQTRHRSPPSKLFALHGWLFIISINNIQGWKSSLNKQRISKTALRKSFLDYCLFILSKPWRLKHMERCWEVRSCLAGRCKIFHHQFCCSCPRLQLLPSSSKCMTSHNHSHFVVTHPHAFFIYSSILPIGRNHKFPCLTWGLDNHLCQENEQTLSRFSCSLH
jgi:hypothetical protein